jgi:hypothetical protein
VRDGIVLIGVLLDHHGEIMIVRPAALRPAVFRPSLLPSSIQLLRCTAEAVPRVALGPLRSSCPLVGGLWLERTDQGETGGSRTRDDGSRTSLRTVDGVARGTRWVVPGLDPDYSIVARVAAEVRGISPLTRVVETRRLELLTLSLQRRCSAS